MGSEQEGIEPAQREGCLGILLREHQDEVLQEATSVIS